MGTILGEGDDPGTSRECPGRGDHLVGRRLRRGARGLERDDRQAPGADRPLLRRRRRDHCSRASRAARTSRSRSGAAGTACPGSPPRDGGDRHRPVADEGHPGRPRARASSRQGGATWRDARPRDAGVRAGGDRRARLDHRRRRVHPRRRDRLAHAQARPGLRQPRRRRHRHRRRPTRARERGREPRALLGPARRGRQLRHRDLVRVPGAPGRADDPRRPDLLSRASRRPRSCADTASTRPTCRTR